MKGIKYQLHNHTNKNNDYSLSTSILLDSKNKRVSKLNEESVEYILKHGYQAIQWRNVCAITCLDVRVVKEELQL